ncbi:DEAD/DEAH box helicase [Methylotenera versatilis]|uniref:DEAD/DEAH box helicase n=1 Tax=Methylotenera versatilis TaxID=1055487 RepID=UPI000645B10B|nr:DEAD/DEAH box helicase [Methylotenera versatilis]
MSFDSLNLHPTILRAVLEAGYDTPTAVQAQAIPPALEGRDIMASAQTGTGKTAAFTLPALNLLATPHALNSRGPRILVLTPTRELAAQVNEAARKYGKYIRARTVSIVGGMPYPLQNKLLSQPLDILVATPGRFIDHMERGRIDLSRLQMLVLDEADRMLDMGFMPDVERICEALPKERQTLLFSATLDGIMHIGKQFLTNPITLQVAGQKEKHANIEQRLHFVDDMTHKNKLLEHLLIAPDVNQAIIFTSTKRHADVLAEDLYAAGHKTAALHGDMTQGARNRTLTKLRQGDVKVLVATDVAARGIDVQGISHVINYDLPKFAEDYVHRIGRTGRANNKGIAISFASNMDRHLLRKIEQYTGQKLDAAVVEGFEPKRSFSTGSGKSDGARRGNDRGGRNERSAHKPGDRGGYQSRDNRGTFGDRVMGEKPAGEKSYGARSGGFNDRNKERTHDGARPARSFGDRPAFGDKPAFSNSERPARNSDRFANSNDNRSSTPREVDGNSRSYTKDTDMQFARELSKGFGGKSGDRTGAPKPYARKPEGSFGDRPNRSEGSRSTPRGDAPRGVAPRNNTGEKFGNPRPQRPTGDRPARNGGDSAPRRPRSFV